MQIERVPAGAEFDFRVTTGEVTVGQGTFASSTKLGNSGVFVANRNITIKSLVVMDHEVTQKEYTAYCKFGGDQPSATYGLGDDYPAYFVSWYDAIVYCNLKTINDPTFGSTETERLNHCVYSMGAQKDPRLWTDRQETNGKYCGPSSNNISWNAITLDLDAAGWRLPTEVEWEYLARGGNLTSSNQTIYSGNDSPDAVAWTSQNSGDNGTNVNNKSHMICTKAPNNLNLYDMSGNVWEWCWDLGNNSGADANTPYDGPHNSGMTNRRARGGSWSETSISCKVESRSHQDPYSRYYDFGFRVVRNAE